MTLKRHQGHEDPMALRLNKTIQIAKLHKEVLEFGVRF
jgi:hypothetical protein